RVRHASHRHAVGPPHGRPPRSGGPSRVPRPQSSTTVALQKENPMPSRAQQLLGLGQSVWLDYIRRRDLLDGTFEGLVKDSGVVGVTSNPTIFQQAIGESDDYDAAIQKRAAEGLTGPALFEALAVEDIQMACDRLKAVAEKSNGLDGRVSIEVSPRL